MGNAADIFINNIKVHLIYGPGVRLRNYFKGFPCLENLYGMHVDDEKDTVCILINKIESLQLVTHAPITSSGCHLEGIQPCRQAAAPDISETPPSGQKTRWSGRRGKERRSLRLVRIFVDSQWNTFCVISDAPKESVFCR